MLLSGPQVDEEDEDTGCKAGTEEIIEELRKVTETFDNKTEEFNNFEKLQATHKKVWGGPLMDPEDWLPWELW